MQAGYAGQWEVVGLYLEPPLKVLALATGGGHEPSLSSEKPPIQASQQGQADGCVPTQQMLALCVVLDHLEQKIVARSSYKDRVRGWLGFLRQIDVEVSNERSVHLLLSFGPVAKAPEVKQWFRKHRRFHAYPSAPGLKWLAQVEHWLGNEFPVGPALGSLAGMHELTQAAVSCLGESLLSPQRFVWCVERTARNRRPAEARNGSLL